MIIINDRIYLVTRYSYLFLKIDCLNFANWIHWIMR